MKRERMPKKVPLLLLPGLLCDKALWRPQLDKLSDIAEARVADFTPFDSIEAMARGVLAKAPPRFAMAGLSMGGFVALAIARQAPERVMAMALLDTSARGVTKGERERFRRECERVRGGGFEELVRGYMPYWVHPDRLSDESLVAELLAMTQRAGPATFLRHRMAILERPDMREELGRIASRVLVLCGREDAITPLRLSEELAQAIPGAELVAVGECGHISTRERPDAVNAALRRWLIKTDGGR
jgi:pimeloyl-ACP methyl ester carboxylesterase